MVCGGHTLKVAGRLARALTAAKLPASGRLQPFDFLDFNKFEGPLSLKAVIQILVPETRPTNDR